MRQNTKINSVLNNLSTTKYAYPVSVHPCIGELLYSLARNLNPSTIVEIGSFIGYSTLCFAQAIKDNNNNKGIVYAIDPFLSHKKSPPFLYEDIDNPLAIAQENAE